jgi:hypothetical protein
MMSEDYHRVDADIDGTEKRIRISKGDMVRMLQESWLGDVEKGWQLISDNLESRLPALISKGIKDHEAEKEAAKNKIIEEYKAANPDLGLKDQVTDMASGKYGFPLTVLGAGLFVVGLALILNLPIVRNMLG